MSKVLSLDDIRAMEEETLPPAVVAQVIGCDPQYIRIMARQHPEQLGFKTITYKSRVKIPRRAFIRFMEEG